VVRVVVAAREAAAPVLEMAVVVVERAQAAALEQVGRAAEVARVQAPAGVAVVSAVSAEALEQGLAAVAVPVKSRASGLLRPRCSVVGSLAVYRAQLALVEAVV
jgi:hypothetical protein